MLPLKPHTIAQLVAGANIPTISFNMQQSLTTWKLTHALDSLVRVSRRVKRCPFTSNSGYQTRIGSTTKKEADASPKETTTPNVSKQKQEHSHTQTASFHAQDCMLQHIRALTRQDSNTTLALPHLWNHMLQSHRMANNRSNLPWALKHPSLPVQQFQALLTLFSKSFSCFPHGTCLLSVSH